MLSEIKDLSRINEVPAAGRQGSAAPSAHPSADRRHISLRWCAVSSNDGDNETNLDRHVDVQPLH